MSGCILLGVALNICFFSFKIHYSTIKQFQTHVIWPESAGKSKACVKLSMGGVSNGLSKMMCLGKYQPGLEISVFKIRISGSLEVEPSWSFQFDHLDLGILKILPDIMLP